MKTITNKENGLNVMINEDGYYVAKDLYPIVIFEELETTETSKLLSSQIQRSCGWNDYMDSIDFLANYLLEESETLEQINFTEPNNTNFVSELKERGYEINEGIIKIRNGRNR